MNYLNLSVWIFVLLVFLVILLLLFPSNFVIVLGTVALPVLIVIQAIVILKAKDESKNHFSDKWYDK